MDRHEQGQEGQQTTQPPTQELPCLPYTNPFCSSEQTDKQRYGSLWDLPDFRASILQEDLVASDP